MSDRRPWTADDDAVLRELVGDGCTYAEVAAELGRTPWGVQRRGERLGIRRTVGRRRDTDRWAWALRRLTAGASVRALSRESGVPVSTAFALVRRMVAAGLLRRVVRGGRVRYVPADRRFSAA